MNTQQNAVVKWAAFFRFYEELNDFLPEKQHKTFFPFDFAGNPSLKNTIEAIGVPHTEIDLILVDGKSVDFDYRMQGGEHVSVYPVFETFDISPISHLRPEPLRETKFVVDVNLGKLAQKLRLLGFDTLFQNDFKDVEIVNYSVQEKRIVLTRDKDLLKHRKLTHGYWIRNKDPEKQIKEAVSRFQLQNSFKPFTRCSCCNSLLQPIDSCLLQNRLSVDILRDYQEFMECPDCERLYWQGSHWERICEWVEGLKIN